MYTSATKASEGAFAKRMLFATKPSTAAGDRRVGDDNRRVVVLLALVSLRELRARPARDGDRVDRGARVVVGVGLDAVAVAVARLVGRGVDREAVAVDGDVVTDRLDVGSERE